MGFITLICCDPSISIVFENRMPYSRYVCNKVMDVISVCLNLYNTAFIHNCLHMKKKLHDPSEL